MLRQLDEGLIAHVHIVESNGAQAFREAYAWL